jgi:drug/metabolite transporter (DMT)-like permease
MPSPSRPAIVAVFVLLTLIWGTTWAAIRIGLRGLPPLTGLGIRFGLASLILLGVAWAMGLRLGRSAGERRLWLVNALCTFFISYSLVYWSEQWVPSGLASVLFATMPLFVAIFAHFALPAERLTRRAVAGILVGFAGVAVIFSEDLTLLGGPQVAFASAVMLGAPFVSAVANVAVKRWGGEIHPISISAVPMAMAAAVIGALALALERGRPVTFDLPSVGSILYLAVFGSAVSFSLYFWLLRHVRATRLSLISYTIPVVAVAVGALAMDEPLTGRVLAGAALVIGGVGLALRTHPAPAKDAPRV